MPPKRGKKAAPKKAAKIEKKLSFSESDNESDIVTKSNKMAAIAKLSESSSDSEQDEQSKQKNEDLSEKEIDASVESEEEDDSDEEQPKAAKQRATAESEEEDDSDEEQPKVAKQRATTESEEEDDSDEEQPKAAKQRATAESEEDDEEEERPKAAKQRAIQKTETNGKPETKGRKNIGRKINPGKAKANQSLVESDIDEKNESRSEEEEAAKAPPKRGAAKKQPVGPVESNSDAKNESDGEEESAKAPPKKGAAKKQPAIRGTKKAEAVKSSRLNGPKGAEKTAATRKMPARSKPQPHSVASTSGNGNVGGKSLQKKATAIVPEQTPAEDDEPHAGSTGNMKIAGVVRDASERLIGLNKYASLALLKKILLSEQSESWVGRNYERIKVVIKQMFSSSEIVPFGRSVKNRSVSIKFKFNSKSAQKKLAATEEATENVETKKKTAKTVVAKQNPKKTVEKEEKPARLKISRKKKTQEEEEFPEFEDDEDVPPKYR